MAKVKKIRIHCPVHDIIEEVAKTSPLRCGKKKIIAENFPLSEDWIFCCSCSAFIQKSAKNLKFCPRCGTNAKIWYLCKNCLIFFFDNFEIKEDKKHFIDENILNRECPNCEYEKKIDDIEPVRHFCEELDIKFFTSREICPFCEHSLPETEENLKSPEKSYIVNNSELLKNLEYQQTFIVSLKTAFEKLSRRCEDLKSTFDEDINNLIEELQKIKGTFLPYEEEKEQRNSYEKVASEEALKESTDQAKNQNFHIKKYIGRKSDSIKSEQEISFTDDRLIETDDDFPTVEANIIEILDDTNKEKSALEKSEKSYVAPSELTGLVSEIIKQFPNMKKLAHYPLGIGDLKIASESDTVIFYLKSIDGKDYAIPSSNSVQNENQFKQYSSIYNADTTRLNGKISIKVPAEIQWDENIKGYLCINKGLADIY